MLSTTNKTIFYLSLSLIIAIVSCSPVKVLTDQDATVDFSNYNTYNFLGWQDNSDKILSDMDKKRIHEAFKREFEARGLQLVEADGEMAVSLFIVVDSKTSITAYTDYSMNRIGGYYRYNRGWGHGYATTSYSQNDYLEGTLVVDVFDGTTKKQVWQGIATGTINENPQKREKSIPKKIAALMKKFPVPKKNK